MQTFGYSNNKQLNSLEIIKSNLLPKSTINIDPFEFGRNTTVDSTIGSWLKMQKIIKEEITLGEIINEQPENYINHVILHRSI